MKKKKLFVQNLDLLVRRLYAIQDINIHNLQADFFFSILKNIL